MKLEKAVVLLSSGLDSTVNLYQACVDVNVVMALTFNYGQRAYEREAFYSQKVCEALNVPHKILDLRWFSDFTQTSLINRDKEIPTVEVEIDNLKASQKSAEKVWVPNRNGIFLNVAAAFAEGLGAKYVVPGFNLEEATTFADNSQDYIDRLNRAFELSTSNSVQVKSYTTSLNKTQIFRLGQSLNVNFDLVWPCYFSGEKLCGLCESCQRYQRAFREAKGV